MNDIFISYSHQDRDRARELAERLKQEGWSVFWDRVTPVGKVWSEVLDEELSNAKVIIVLWSNYSVKSNFVRDEAQEGAERKLLAPALLDRIKLPLGFRTFQTADISLWKYGDPDTEGIRLLVEAVAKIGNIRSREEVERIDREQTLRNDEQIEQKKLEQREEDKVELKEIINTTPRKTGIKFWYHTIFDHAKYIIIGTSILTVLLISIWIVRNIGIKEKFTQKSTPALQSLLTDIDGNKYRTVVIGKQVWMAENLKTTRLNDGTVIPLNKGEEVWGKLKIQCYCWYNNDSAKYGAVYGALYNWYAVNTGKLCPDGWHVPSDSGCGMEMIIGCM